MFTFLICLLINVAIAVLFLMVLFWLIGLIFPIPWRIQQIIYVIVLLCFLLDLVMGLSAGGSGYLFFRLG